MTRPGFVTGLQSEAQCLRSSFAALPEHRRPLVICLGPGPSKASEATRRLLEHGADPLISFGLAGGLAPHLAAGDLLIASRIVTDTGVEYDISAASARMANALADALPFQTGTLIGLERPVRLPDEKAALYRARGAVAADMESHAVAAVAAGSDHEVLAFRVVVDHAGLSLPYAAVNAVDDDGRTRTARVLRGLFGHPGGVPALIRLAFHHAAAMRTLNRLAQSLCLMMNNDRAAG